MKHVEVMDYNTGESFGDCRVSDTDYELYKRDAQWPEGIIRAGDVDSITEHVGVDPDVTVWLQER